MRKNWHRQSAIQNFNTFGSDRYPIQRAPLFAGWVITIGHGLRITQKTVLRRFHLEIMKAARGHCTLNEWRIFN